MRLFRGFAADWRRGRDSNPCALSRKLISSQPRYDHFDTSPYMSTLKMRETIVIQFLENPLDKPERRIINQAKSKQNPSKNPMKQGFSAVGGGTTTQMRP